MRIAVLYICTGHYDVFWPEFYESAERYFYPEDHKEYFVFTDSKELIANKKIHAYYQAKTGWPYDTLLRYNWFCTIQDKLKDFDYCYFINANALFLKCVDSSIIPYPSENLPYVFSIHIRSYDDYDGQTFNPERNPASRAYIPEGMPCRAHSGGFWGGTSQAIIDMCCELRDRIAEDLSNNIIAIWHDQSHLIKYATEVPHYDVEKGLVVSEEYADLSVAVMIYRDKTRYGGNDALRDASKSEKIKHLPKRIYRQVLSRLDKVHLGGILRKIVNLAKR